MYSSNCNVLFFGAPLNAYNVMLFLASCTCQSAAKSG